MLDVRGRDVATESYRVATTVGGRPVVGLLPERLVTDPGLGPRPSHQTAYEWIADHTQQIEAALASLASGQRPKTPYDTITLIEDP